MLVGRAAELGRLDALLEAAAAGTRQLAFVVGEPGIGKTTLVDMFLDRVRARGQARIGRGQCLDQHGAGEPYLPVLEALGRLCRGDGGAELIALLARGAPTWLAQMPSLLGTAELEAVQRRAFGTTRERMLREMVEALETFAATVPLVLLLEDLHWSDPSTIDLLAGIGQRPEPARLLVIGTYRAGEGSGGLSNTVRTLRRHGRGTEVALGPWSEADARAYLAARCPSGELPAAAADLILRRTERHPLFVRSLVDEWQETGALTVPDTLRASIEQRIERLSPADQDVLGVASVAGAEFAAAVVAAALEHTEEEVETWLYRLARQGWVREAEPAEWPDGTLTTRFTFVHHLHQELLYHRLPLARRTQLHGRVARRLVSAYGARGADRAAELALHFHRGRDDERAVHFLRLAAEHAVARSAYHEAIGHVTDAVEILRRRPDLPDAPAVELQLQRVLGSALLVTRGWGDRDAEAAYNRARELSETLDDPQQLAKVLYGLAYLHEIRGDYAVSQTLIERRLNLHPSAEQPGSLLEAHELLSCSLFHQGSFEAALKHARCGLDLFETEDRNALFVSLGENAGIACHYWNGLTLWFIGRPDEAVASVQRAISLCDEVGHIYMASFAEAQAARLFHHRREADRTAAHAARALAIAERQGYPYQRAIARTFLGWADVIRGNTAAGLAQLRAGLEGQAELGAGMERPYGLALLAEALAHSGDDDAALAQIAEALRLAEANARSFFWEAELHRMRGLLLLRRSDRSAAEASVRHALEIATRQGARSLELRAAVSLYRLGTPDAPELLRQRLAGFAEGFDTPDFREASAVRDGSAP